MALAAGERLGHYIVVSQLGAGGMGEVYHARDAQLGRDVAIKVLPDHLTADAQALSRFHREARALAALSHPNVVTIHQLDSGAAKPYLVMELLHGETLSARIARSPLPWRKAVEIGASIADALAAAHDQDIVHRDLKPANIWITSAGHVKVLDFGLARQRVEESFSEDAPTATAPGVVLGTIGYMSPEQVTGGAVDQRTDLFAFGCVMYEALTGRSPFARSTFSETAAAVLADDPMARDKIADAAPPEVWRIIGRCLEKKPEERFQNARDLAFRLRELTSGASPNSPRSTRPLRVAIALLIAFAVVVAAGVVVSGRRRAPDSPSVAAERARSIMVLPFENATREPDDEFLADGITEGLINALATLPRVRVIARTTAFTYKGQPVDFARIRREMHVDTALMGKVVARGGSLTVQSELVDLATGSAIWGDRFHQSVSDPHRIEQTIVTAIAERLRVRLSSDQENRLHAPRTQSREAYELYLRGRHEFNKRTAGGMQQAKVYFQKAIDADPTFGLAYSGLADTYVIMLGDFGLISREEGIPKAEQAALRAVELDPDLAEGRVSLGHLRHVQWNWPAAERELMRAVELNPNYATARMWYSLGLRDVGRMEESLREVRTAQQLDPLAPVVTANLAHKLNTVRAYNEALVEANRALELNPRFVYGHWNAALAYEGLGRYEEAADSYRQMSETTAPSGIARAGLGRAYAKTGRLTEARTIARELKEEAGRGEIHFTPVAWVYSALGERDEAFALLERAWEDRESWLRHSLRLPCLGELESDPRYTALVQRLSDTMMSVR